MKRPRAQLPDLETRLRPLGYGAAGRCQPSLTGWLPDMDLNHDKQIQSLLCYRYTIGQSGAADTVTISIGESSS